MTHDSNHIFSVYSRTLIMTEICIIFESFVIDLFIHIRNQPEKLNSSAVWHGYATHSMTIYFLRASFIVELELCIIFESLVIKLYIYEMCAAGSSRRSKFSPRDAKAGQPGLPNIIGAELLRGENFDRRLLCSETALPCGMVT